MSELIERYKVVASELQRLEEEAGKLKIEREALCTKLMAQDGKGHVYDFGDDMPMIVAMTKIGTCYMAPKNKWRKAGRLPQPKPPKVAKAEKPPKEAKPATKRMIVGGKIVEIPIPPRTPTTPPPPPVAEVKTSPVPEVKKEPASVPAPEPTIAEMFEAVENPAEPVVVAAPASEPPPAPKVVAKPAAQKPPMDDLEAALAALDASDLE